MIAANSTTIEGTVTVTVRDAVGIVTISRPGKHNALTRSMWKAVEPALRESAAAGVRVVVLTGAGQTFSAGADLRDVLAATETAAAAREYCTMVVAALQAVATCPVPTVAAIRGPAAGGGAELALAADVRVAEASSTLALPLGRLGVVPDLLTLRRLVALGGPSVARAMLFGGRRFSADRCREVGLVDEVVPDGELDEAVAVWAHDLSAAYPSAVRHTKRMLLDLEADAEEGDLCAAMVASFVSGDVATGARQFLADDSRA